MADQPPIEETLNNSLQIVEQIRSFNDNWPGDLSEVWKVLEPAAENITQLVFHLTQGRELYGNQWRRAQHFEQQAMELEILLQFIPGDVVYRAIRELRARQEQAFNSTQELDTTHEHSEHSRPATNG